MNITELIEANREFACNADRKELRRLAEEGQHPVATVIACSDSRVPVEVIFNQLKPGRLFVIRVAGNIVADPSVRGSIEYAVAHLKTPCLIVLGHSDCGAIKAYLAGAGHGEVGELLGKIALKSRGLEEAVLENIDLQVKRALEIHGVREALESGSLEVYGMLYDLRTGCLTCVSRNGLPCVDANRAARWASP